MCECASLLKTTPYLSSNTTTWTRRPNISTICSPSWVPAPLSGWARVEHPTMMKGELILLYHNRRLHYTHPWSIFNSFFLLSHRFRDEVWPFWGICHVEAKGRRFNLEKKRLGLRLMQCPPDVVECVSCGVTQRVSLWVWAVITLRETCHPLLKSYHREARQRVFVLVLSWCRV